MSAAAGESVPLNINLRRRILFPMRSPCPVPWAIPNAAGPKLTAMLLLTGKLVGPKDVKPIALKVCAVLFSALSAISRFTMRLMDCLRGALRVALLLKVDFRETRLDFLA